MALTVDSLPSEILAEIFKIGSALPETRYEHPLLLRVSSVSKRWRDVALGCAEAWSKITLSPFRPIEIIKLYFDRAKSHLLDIILFHYSPEDYHGEDCNAFEEYALSMIDRWRSLTIDTLNVLNVHEVADILETAFAPNLQAIDIKMRSPPVLKEVKKFFQAGVPSLRKVSIYGIGGFYLPPLINLTTFEIDEFYPTHAELQSILSDSPSLQTLVLNRFRSGHAKAQIDDALIEIPSLRTFALCYHPRAQHELYEFECHCPQTFLCMPNLEYLELSGKNLPHLFSHFQAKPEIPAFVHLRKLRFHDIELRGEDLKLLRVMPELEYLEFDKCKLPSDREEENENGNAEALALNNPKLRTIVVSGLSNQSQKWLQEYLRGRKETRYPILDLYISNCDECMLTEDDDGLALPWPRFNGSENDPNRKEFVNLIQTIYPVSDQRPFLMARSDEDFSADIEGEDWKDDLDGDTFDMDDDGAEFDGEEEFPEDYEDEYDDDGDWEGEEF